MDEMRRLSDEVKKLNDEYWKWGKVASSNLGKAIEISQKNNNRATKYWPAEDVVEFETCIDNERDAMDRCDNLLKLRREKEKELNILRSNKKQQKTEFKTEDVAEIVTQSTGIPTVQLTKEKIAPLLKIEERKRYCDMDEFAQSICENMELTEDEANKFIHLLWGQSAADVVEVKHGKWVDDIFGQGDMICSECEQYPATDEDGNPLSALACWQPEYCPNCGAIMDKESEE